MKRTPLPRTEFKRKEPSFSRSEHPRAKEGGERKAPGAKTCAHCGKPFQPWSSTQQVCATARCAKGWLAAKKKAERASIKARKAALTTLPELLAKAQADVNKYCRLRDLRAGKGCISCGARPAQKFGGSMDAGHYRSVGSASHLRFFTSQIRLQCVRCNRDLSGNAVEFRKGLVAERGAPWVEWLESLWWVAKWNKDDLMRLARLARKKTRRLEQRMERA